MTYPNKPISAFDFDIMKSALRKIAVDEREPWLLRHEAYQLARALCPDQEFSEELIDALMMGVKAPDEAGDGA